MPRKSKISDAECLAAYAEHGTLTGAAAALGINRTSLHERLVKLGASKPVNLFSPEEEAELAADYQAYADAGRLDALAERMGRTKHFLCRKARDLGLTQRSRSKSYLRKWERIDRHTARALFDAFIKSRKAFGPWCRERGYCRNGVSSLFHFHFPAEHEAAMESQRAKNWRYAAGTRFEYRVRDHFEKLGAFTMRSPASKSPVDLIAVYRGSALFIQCKIGAWHAVGEWNAFLDLAERHGATPIYATREGARTLRVYEMTQRKDGSRRPLELPEWRP